MEKIYKLINIHTHMQGGNAWKVNSSCVYAACIRIDASVFVRYPRRLKALNFDNFDNSHKSFL